MEKKSLNKKLQLNKETIAELNKDEQSQILGGDLPTSANCPPGETRELGCDDEIYVTEGKCVFSRDVCFPTEGTCLSEQNTYF